MTKEKNKTKGSQPSDEENPLPSDGVTTEPVILCGDFDSIMSTLENADKQLNSQQHRHTVNCCQEKPEKKTAWDYHLLLNAGIEFLQTGIRVYYLFQPAVANLVGHAASNETNQIIIGTCVALPGAYVAYSTARCHYGVNASNQHASCCTPIPTEQQWLSEATLDYLKSYGLGPMLDIDMHLVNDRIAHGADYLGVFSWFSAAVIYPQLNDWQKILFSIGLIALSLGMAEADKRNCEHATHSQQHQTLIPYTQHTPDLWTGLAMLGFGSNALATQLVYSLNTLTLGGAMAESSIYIDPLSLNDQDATLTSLLALLLALISITSLAATYGNAVFNTNAQYGQDHYKLPNGTQLTWHQTVSLRSLNVVFGVGFAATLMLPVINHVDQQQYAIPCFVATVALTAIGVYGTRSDVNSYERHFKIWNDSFKTEAQKSLLANG